MNCDTFFTMKDKGYFKEQLARQLRFIRNSCRLYDEGNKEEAIRIGTSLRVLMRDTTDRKGRPLSVSLFSHLKAKDKIKINSSCHPPSPRVFEFRGMGRETLKITEDYKAYRWVEPILDYEAHPPTPVPVDEWWEMPVYVSRQGSQLRLGNTLAAIAGKDFFIKRGDIILGAVENDGGAHVDADLSPDYEHLAAVGGYRMYEEKIELPNGNVAHLPPIKDAHLIYLRQMGFETLTSPGVHTLLSIYN